MTETVPQSPALEEALPEELGARRIAALLTQATGLAVTGDDVDSLVAQRHLSSASSCRGWPLYSTADALALDRELIGSVVGERLAWEAASLPGDAAAARIGWHWRDLQRMGDEGRLTRGRFDRYLITDLDVLAAEADGEQRVTAQTAADVLEIRPADWRYVEAAGWIQPAETYEMPVGRRRTVTVALFQLGEVRALRDLPIGWEAVRGLPKGAPSPLREYARLAPARATVVRAFAQALADRHGVEVWAWSNPYTGGWELGWEARDGAPTVTQVKTELAEDPAAACYAAELTLGTEWGVITRQARRLLEPGVAVILDTETTDLAGQAIEVAVRDAASGKLLMDTLVRPTERISQGAFWVHGIRDEDVADAPPWEKVLPRLRRVTKGRMICAYNAPFDRSIILGDTARTGKKPLHLEPKTSWFCLMEAYRAWLGASRWLRLGGSHRAAGDCEAAREVLSLMASGRGTTFTPTRPAPGDPVSGPPTGTALAAVPTS